MIKERLWCDARQCGGSSGGYGECGVVAMMQGGCGMMPGSGGSRGGYATTTYHNRHHGRARSDGWQVIRLIRRNDHGRVWIKVVAGLGGRVVLNVEELTTILMLRVDKSGSSGRWRRGGGVPGG
ncbi:hypothetical protein Pmani_027847 [Petrolisthes manimaculis]|uniref:Uncharacterized protein n=1 Tax=Petrolisthes manimaculis TaxID=1843537 RepID=A0AAE1P1V6_9EUCA|nr:hypothetical protein Pmani_027847 [Petrolisthes manimaculis]